MVIAWRIYYMTMLGREIPNLPCTVIFNDIEVVFVREPDLSVFHRQDAVVGNGYPADVSPDAANHLFRAGKGRFCIRSG
jgi:hypothetical protein